MTETATAPQEKVKGRRKEMVGRVVSNKMQKTVVVAVDKVKHHRLYKRTIRLTKKYYAHDETDALQIGDTVRIVETRPLSKLKRWRVAEVVRPGTGAPVQIADPTSVVEQVQETASSVVGTVASAAASAAAAVLPVAASAASAAGSAIVDVVSSVAQNVLSPTAPADAKASDEETSEAVTSGEQTSEEAPADEPPAPRRRRAKAQDSEE